MPFTYSMFAPKKDKHKKTKSSSKYDIAIQGIKTIKIEDVRPEGPRIVNLASLKSEAKILYDSLPDGHKTKKKCSKIMKHPCQSPDDFDYLEKKLPEKIKEMQEALSLHEASMTSGLTI